MSHLIDVVFIFIIFGVICWEERGKGREGKGVGAGQERR